MAPGLSREESDGEAIADHIRKLVIQMRKKGDLEAEQAREIYDDSHRVDCQGDLQYWEHTEIMFGEEWWHVDLPTRPNPEYVYLCRIIDAVREGLKLANQLAA